MEEKEGVRSYRPGVLDPDEHTLDLGPTERLEGGSGLGDREEKDEHVAAGADTSSASCGAKSAMTSSSLPCADSLATHNAFFSWAAPSTMAAAPNAEGTHGRRSNDISGSEDHGRERSLGARVCMWGFGLSEMGNGAGCGEQPPGRTVYTAGRAGTVARLRRVCERHRFYPCSNISSRHEAYSHHC